VWRAINKAGRFWRISCTQVAASREVLSGRQDLLDPHTTKSATAPDPEALAEPVAPEI